MQSQIRRTAPDSSYQSEIVISECEVEAPEPLWRRLTRRLRFLSRNRRFADHAEQRAFEAEWEQERGTTRAMLEATFRRLP